MQFKGLSRVFSQHFSSKASILLCSVFFIVQLSHPYMTTGKTIALARQTFVDEVLINIGGNLIYIGKTFAYIVRAEISLVFIIHEKCIISQ